MSVSKTKTASPVAWLALALATAACAPPAEPPAPSASSDGWLSFEGTWSGAGTRTRLELGGDRKSALVDLRGTMLLAGAGRPGAGFRADVIALTDSATGLVGRSVWTDERGDRVFSELKGEGTAEKNRITGTFLGGTGRYAGVTGDYEFSWRFVMEGEDGSVQGRAAGLKGRFRVASGAPGARP